MRGYQRTQRGEHLPSAFLWPLVHLRSMVPLAMALAQTEVDHATNEIARFRPLLERSAARHP